jgi:hypothetical protein
MIGTPAGAVLARPADLRVREGETATVGGTEPSAGEPWPQHQPEPSDRYEQNVKSLSPQDIKRLKSLVLACALVGARVRMLLVGTGLRTQIWTSPCNLPR